MPISGNLSALQGDDRAWKRAMLEASKAGLIEYEPDCGEEKELHKLFEKVCRTAGVPVPHRFGHIIRGKEGCAWFAITEIPCSDAVKNLNYEVYKARDDWRYDVHAYDDEWNPATPLNAQT